jgi:hypothetical protein
MNRSARLLASLLLLAAFPPSQVLAHEGQGPWVDVPTRHPRQGGEIVVVGGDLGAQAVVEVRVQSFGRRYPLGQVQADGEGHFTQTFTVPAEIGDGYAAVEAVSSEGLDASLWVLIGEAQDLSADTPPPAPENAVWMDPSVLVLGVFVAGAALVVGYLLLKPTAARVPKPAGRRSTSKRRRRTG